MLERISIEALKKSLGIKICCGRLSYSNLLESYDIMIGLSGNLNTVTNFQKKMFSETYKVNKETIVPPIYEHTKLMYHNLIIKSYEHHTATIVTRLKDLRS